MEYKKKWQCIDRTYAYASFVHPIKGATKMGVKRSSDSCVVANLVIPIFCFAKRAGVQAPRLDMTRD